MSLTDPTAVALAHAVDGQFRLEREIGRGGMGVVYLATDVQLERHVALKTLPPHLAADASVRGRFVREARTAAALSHPNIVPIHHAAERDAVVYFAMGYVPGDSLADRIARAPMHDDELVPVLIELADALGYAHGRGVVHRDVKGENVLIDSRTGRAMVTDFGIARVTEAQPLTATGTVLGTVHYMSPEQVLGESLDGRADLYALGVLAFYALTGRFPFERANAPATLVAHVNSAAPRVHEYNPDASDRMDVIVARLLEKKPDDRFANAGALIAALRGASDTGARAPGSAVAAPRPVAGLAPIGTEDARPSDIVSAPTVLSSDEAQQVWARAAELQANTGMLSPPPAFALRREAGADDAEFATRGYDASLVRASAEDAGIPARYVDRALAEREAMRPVAVTSGSGMSGPAHALAGAHMKLEFSAEIEGELNDVGFEEVADEIRNALGEMVSVSAVGRTLTVTTAAGGGGGFGPGRRGSQPRMVQVHVSSRNGRTVIRGFEDLSGTATGMFGGIMGGLGMGGGMAVMGSMLAHNGGLLAVGSWLGVLATTYGAARLLFTRTSRKREVELKATVERVTVCARRYVVRTPGKTS